MVTLTEFGTKWKKVAEKAVEKEFDADKAYSELKQKLDSQLLSKDEDKRKQLNHIMDYVLDVSAITKIEGKNLKPLLRKYQAEKLKELPPEVEEIPKV